MPAILPGVLVAVLTAVVATFAAQIVPLAGAPVRAIGAHKTRTHATVCAVLAKFEPYRSSKFTATRLLLEPS